jgi:uncharacterized protein YbjQ (UPF0145 family)
MPQFGTGILPSGALGTQLAAVTRRAFIPRLVVQLYKATPFLSILLRNAQRAKGGASQVTVPVQGSSFVSFSWSDYSGVFPQPADVAAAQNAEFNLKLGVVPIPFMGMESIIQSSEVVIPLLKARMADAKTVAMQAISSAAFATGANPGNQVDGLYAAYDDGTNVSTYGGISRTTNPFWKAQIVSNVNAALTRVSLLQYLVQATSGTTTVTGGGGEAPDFVIMNPSDWATLIKDFMVLYNSTTPVQALEQFNITPKGKFGADNVINTGFRGVTIGDTPVFMDMFCPKGTAYLINSRYLAMYMSEDAPFAFSGFYSTIPNLQIANIGVMIVIFNIVCTKPASGMRLAGITGGAF